MDSVGGNIHLLQAALSAYSLFHAYNSITKLRTWEPTAKKAAEWSEAAAQELQKTRTTQTSGTVAIVASLVSSFVYIAYPPADTKVSLGLNLAVATVCVLARTHISRFWKTKSKKPLATGYNDALTSTIEIRGQLGILALAWFSTAVLEAQETSGSWNGFGL